jgi:tetratricopeptide (TPR) repeat protein
MTKQSIFSSVLIIFLLLTTLSAQDPYAAKLIEKLKNADPQIRKNAVELLGSDKNTAKQAVEPLIDTLNDTDAAVREAAYQVLKRITKQDFPPQYDPWINWWEKEGAKQFGENVGFTRDITETKTYITFAFISMIVILILILLFIGIFSFMGGSKIKEMKEITKRLEKYLLEADEVTQKSDRVIAELEQRRTELIGFFSKLKEENESEIERFSDLLQQNVEHRMRESTMQLREKAEMELEQTLNRFKEDVQREITRLVNEQKEKTIGEFTSYEARFLREIEAYIVFLEGSFDLIHEKYEDALRAYKKVLTLKPDHQLGWVNNGLTLRKLGRYNEALESYEQALHLSPDDPPSLYQTAATYALLRKKEKMLEYLTRAFQFDGELKDESLNDPAFQSYWHDPDFKNVAES